MGTWLVRGVLEVSNGAQEYVETGVNDAKLMERLVGAHCNHDGGSRDAATPCLINIRT